MGRELRRVPLDFDWPIDKVWEGFLTPANLRPEGCSTCSDGGWSPEAKRLHDRWYGYVPFDPAETGSTPFTPETPEVRTFAERNVSGSPDFYGAGEWAVVREAKRLCRLWNSEWCHHLAQEDVDALVAAERLMDFTHTWDKENRWQPRVPAVHPTAEQVNRWSLIGFGHDGINAHVVIRAACERQGVPVTCAVCEGHGYTYRDDAHRQAAEAWGATDPPAGEGWQLWETTSEGSPVSPVFATADNLIDWMATTPRHFDGQPYSREAAELFVRGDGWAPSLISTPETGVVDGVEALAAVKRG